LWADDFWGEYAFRVWANELAKALPPERYPIVDIPLDHSLFHTLYDVRRIPQIPSIGFWGGPGSSTTSGVFRRFLRSDSGAAPAPRRQNGDATAPCRTYGQCSTKTAGSWY
jgi:hypothetical protein